MKFSFKDYKIFKTKNYIKKNNLFFFFGGVYKSFDNWIFIEQGLKNINYNYYKTFNRTTKKIFNNSIYKPIESSINGITFFIKSTNQQLSKQVLVTNYEPLLFNMLSIKINNKIYQTTQLKKSYSLNYQDNKLLIFQYGITHFKTKSK